MYKAAFRDPRVRDRFNQALKAINDDGTVRAILRKYERTANAGAG